MATIMFGKPVLHSRWRITQHGFQPRNSNRHLRWYTRPRVWSPAPPATKTNTATTTATTATTPPPTPPLLPPRSRQRTPPPAKPTPPPPPPANCPFCHAQFSSVVVLGTHIKHQCANLLPDHVYISQCRPPPDLADDERIVLPITTALGLFDWPLDTTNRRVHVKEIRQRFLWDGDIWLAIVLDDSDDSDDQTKVVYCPEDLIQEYVTESTRVVPVSEIAVPDGSIILVPGYRPQLVIKNIF